MVDSISLAMNAQQCEREIFNGEHRDFVRFNT